MMNLEKAEPEIPNNSGNASKYLSIYLHLEKKNSIWGMVFFKQKNKPKKGKKVWFATQSNILRFGKRT